MVRRAATKKRGQPSEQSPKAHPQAFLQHTHSPVGADLFQVLLASGRTLRSGNTTSEGKRGMQVMKVKQCLKARD